jgi:hypothetical protein
MRVVRAFVLALVFGTTLLAAEAPLSFETGGIALLTGQGDMSRRTGGSVTELGEYLLQLKSAGVAFISSAKDAPRVTGAYVVVVKPGKRSRIWVHLIGTESNQEFVDGLSSALQSVEPPVVVEGPIALSVSFRTWPKGAFPIPFVGVAALYRGIDKQSAPMDTDTLIKLVWPDDGG